MIFFKRKEEPLRQLRPSFRNKVFCVGLPKTGTSTLGKCFKELGYKHKSFDSSLTVRVRRGDLDSAFSEARRYEAFEDWPWFLIYENLAERFPHAKFILTYRKSAEAYAHSLWRFRKRKGVYEDDFQEPWWWREVVQSSPKRWDIDELCNYYIKHNRKVEEFFSKSPNNFISVCWENGDGWSKICQFLDKKVPDKKFPHLNRTS